MRIVITTLIAMILGSMWAMFCGAMVADRGSSFVLTIIGAFAIGCVVGLLGLRR